MICDGDIIEGLKAGDHRCWTLLYSRHHKPLINYLRRRYHFLREDEIEDILQGAWEVAWNMRERLVLPTPQGNLRPALYHVMVVLTKQRIHTHARNKHAALYNWPAQTSEPQQAHIEIATVVSEAQRLLSYTRLDEYKAVMNVFFFGMSYEEAAKKEGISLRALGGRLTTAKRRMRAALLLDRTDLPALDKIFDGIWPETSSRTESVNRYNRKRLRETPLV